MFGQKKKIFIEGLLKLFLEIRVYIGCVLGSLTSVQVIPTVGLSYFERGNHPVGVLIHLCVLFPQ
jgi:hypothetical protein